MRAIVMTSFAFILGCVPLAIATGPGANSLRAIGTGVIGGMLASTVIAIFFIPLFFWLLESMSERFAREKRPASGGHTAPGAPATAPHAKREGE
jgi:multidrug efflux pump